MKHPRLSLLVAFSIFFSTYSHAAMLNQATIDKKAVEIEKKLQQERYIKYALVSISVAHEVYQWVPMIKDFMAHKSTVTTKEEKLGFFKSLVAGAKHLFGTQAGLESLIQSVFSIGGFVIISQMGEKFIHPDTLRWYIAACAPYQLTIKLMKKQLQNLQDPSLDLQQQQINNDMLHMLYDRLVHQAECMSAYMAYKIKRFNVAEKIVGERAKISMFSVHSNWLIRIAEQINAAKCDFKTIEMLLDNYQSALTAQINHFALIEGETRRDRIAVKKQMKLQEY
jgi:hypothetical protein